MKACLQPELCISISNNRILWFEDSNRYLVVSLSLWEIIKVYFKTTNKLEFIKESVNKFNFPVKQGELYFNEIDELLTTINLVEDTKLGTVIVPPIPDYALEVLYSFGKTNIKLHFGSEHIKALIHPQWVHAISSAPVFDNLEFHIFRQENFLYIFKNKNYVGQFSTLEYHLLQGKFALQIINALYNKIESDWMATFHASTVCNDKEAIMLIGDSGNGKSTLSALLMAHGIDVLADDFTPLAAANKEVYRFPSGISVKAGAYEMLRPLYPEFDKLPEFKSTSKNVNVKYIPPIKSTEDGPLHLPCTKIVYVNYDKNSISNIKRIGIEKVLETLIPESWISPLTQNSKLFLEWLKDLECFELNYSDNEFAITSIKELLKS